MLGGSHDSTLLRHYSNHEQDQHRKPVSRAGLYGRGQICFHLRMCTYIARSWVFDTHFISSHRYLST